MKEKFIKAILRLLAIVAKEEDITEREREVVRHFLQQNMRQSDVPPYIEFFDAVSKRIQDYTKEQDYVAITQTCQHLNKELTKTQKILVLLNFIELIIADGIITEHEDNLLFRIGQALRVEKDIIQLIRNFIIYDEQKDLDSPYTLFVDSNDGSLYGTSKHIKHAHLKGFVIFLRLPQHTQYFVKHIGKDAISLNGIPLAERKVMNFAPGSVVKMPPDSSVHYSDVVSNLISREAHDKISLTAKNVYCSLKEGRFSLQNITIEEESGKLVAIMGNSGSGKTTLINVLNTQLKPSKGQVCINGLDIHQEADKIQGIIGYIPQDDLLMEDLTVFENLFYAAKLCFKRLSKKQITQRVNRTLNSLGLLEISPLKVGSPTKKVISGGQRKRLNIALELIREPGILFVDEPTSGLSSRDSELIMDLLKDLALKGKLVITVIHQPSSAIFKMFDSLILLDAGGYQIYYGNPVEAITYFKEAMESLDKNHPICVECGNVNPEQIFNIIETRIIDEYGRPTENRRILPPTWEEAFSKSKYYKTVTEAPAVKKLPSKRSIIANRATQLITFIQRDLRSKLANKQYLFINLLEPVFLAAILAFLVRHTPESNEAYTFADNKNIAIYFFMSIIVSMFMGLTVSAGEIFKDRKILKREEFLNISRSSYLLSKMTILFGLSAIQTLSYVVVSEMILDIDSMTFTYWLILFSTSCFANVLGLNISAAFNSAVTIYIVVPLLIIPQIILSGVVVDFDALTPLLSNKKKVPWIGETTTSRWALEALLVKQFTDTPYNRDFYEVDKKISMAEYNVHYWGTMMEKYMATALQNKKDNNTAELKENLTLIRNELAKKVPRHSSDLIPEYKTINTENFNNALYNRCLDFIKQVKKYHTTARKAAIQERENILRTYKESPEKESLASLKNRYDNNLIKQIVKNTSAQTSIAQADNELIPLIYPIYSTPHPKHALDSRTRFLYPIKYFAGNYYDTWIFNTGVIWIMTLTLVIVLYLNLLKRLISAFFD